MTVKEKIYTSILGLAAYYFKMKTYILLFFLKKRIIEFNDNPHLIVSLTSYGRRVYSCVHFAIMSILLQKNITVDKVILTLDKNNWNPDNLPWSLKKLIKLGVDIFFVEDLKSYKKLIPVLSKYGDSIIVTIDDDYYYSENLIKKLYDKHQEKPNAIICNWAYVPEFIDDCPVPYLSWEKLDYKKQNSYKYIFPLGCAGVLYPAGTLPEEVCNREIFFKLAPSNDDLWFWIMAILAGTKHFMIDNNDVVLYPTDLLYQVSHRNSALYYINHKDNEDKDDICLKNLISHYNLSFCSNKK
jgi:hypothetical protein